MKRNNKSAMKLEITALTSMTHKDTGHYYS